MKSKNSLSQKNLNLTKEYIKSTSTLKDFFRLIDPNKAKLKKIEALLHGSFKSSFVGPGFDFNEIREYRMGDDLRHIDWNATAKTRTLQVKEYFSEREIRSYFLIDISNSMFCGNKLEPFIKLVSFLLTISCTFSERIGGVLFSNEIKYYFPLKEANFQANVIFKTLYSLIENWNTKILPFTNTDIVKALEFTKRNFLKKGVIFLISDFINLSNWQKFAYELSLKQNIYSFQVFDLVDFNLPKGGYIPLIDPETNQRSFVNTDSKLVQQKYYYLMKEKQDNLNHFLKTISVSHFVIDKNDF